MQLVKTLVFIPFPLIGHMISSMEMAKHLIEREQNLSITILVFKSSPDAIDVDSIANGWINSRINFVELHKNEPVNVSALMRFTTSDIIRFIENLMNDVRDVVSKIKAESVLSGFIIDMLNTPMIDVANEFKVPTYIYFTSGAAVLGLLFHLQSQRDDHDLDLKKYVDDLDAELHVPTYSHPFPRRLIPSPVFDGDLSFLDLFKRFKETKGILINTFLELEKNAILALTGDEKIPQVYHVGPILHCTGKKEIYDENNEKHAEIIRWLDAQPDSSVVFLCFGSKGSLDEEQVKEIALALEQSGQRFIWSLRKPPSKKKVEFVGDYENLEVVLPEGFMKRTAGIGKSLRKPTSKKKVEFVGDYENLEVVLPEGFMKRTAGIGKVIGWAPQMAVLSHPATGGFVSHCGWNSTLESISCGVPMAVWPLGAEQQANSFQMVKDLGMAVEIDMNYRTGSGGIVEAEKIGNAIKKLMEPESEMRKKVKAMEKNSEMALQEGGSSYECLGTLLEDVKQYELV